MGSERYSKAEAFRYGWNMMKNNFGFFIILLLIVGTFYIVPNIVSTLLEQSDPGLSGIINLVAMIINLFMGMGMIKVALKMSNDEKGEIDDLFSAWPLFLNYLGGSILYGLIIFGGILLLIIPGFIWAIKFQFYGYFIVDKGMGPIEALKHSAAITAGVKGDLLLFGLLVGCINFLGVLCLFVGLFATIPTTMLALVFVYRALQPRPQGEITAQEPEG